MASNPKMEYSSVRISRACTFINFDKKIPPARPFSGPHIYLFWEKIPPCTALWVCMFNVFKEFSHLHVYLALYVYLAH